LAIWAAAVGDGLQIRVMSFVSSEACAGVILRVEEWSHGGREVDWEVEVGAGVDVDDELVTGA
jgi:hypothetical protein